MGGKKRSHNEFVELIEKLYPNLEVITPFTATKERIRVLCKKCNTESTPLAQNLINSMFKCRQCDFNNRKESFIQQLSVINPNICVVGEYQNYKTKIECKCLIHDTIFSMTGSNLIAGHGCPECAIDNRRKAFAKSHNDFVSELKKISPTINIKSQYVSSHKKIKCQCSICNYEWMTTPHSLLRGDRCPKCFSISKGEETILKTLDELNIEYIYQKRFEDCKNQLPLAFDFYIPKHNMCIEFQGQQHYEPIKYYGGENEFKIRQKRDSIKEIYCQQSNINLLCIPYWEYDYIEQIIKVLFMKGENE